MPGVCLGHQAIAEAFGAVGGRAPELVHGRTSQVLHEGQGVLAGLPSPFSAARYHSLAVDPATVPAEPEVTAHTEAGIVMALRHRELPIEGVQFYPESVLTEGPPAAGELADHVHRPSPQRVLGLQPPTTSRTISSSGAALLPAAGSVPTAVPGACPSPSVSW